MEEQAGVAQPPTRWGGRVDTDAGLAMEGDAQKNQSVALYYTAAVDGGQEVESQPGQAAIPTVGQRAQPPDNSGARAVQSPMPPATLHHPAVTVDRKSPTLSAVQFINTILQKAPLTLRCVTDGMLSAPHYPSMPHALGRETWDSWGGTTPSGLAPGEELLATLAPTGVSRGKNRQQPAHGQTVGADLHLLQAAAQPIPVSPQSSPGRGTAPPASPPALPTAAQTAGLRQELLEDLSRQVTTLVSRQPQYSIEEISARVYRSLESRLTSERIRRGE